MMITSASVTVRRASHLVGSITSYTYTLRIEKKPFSTVHVSFIHRRLNCQGARTAAVTNKMTPELSNKAFSAKSTQFIQSKRCKEPYNIALETSKQGM